MSSEYNYLFKLLLVGDFDVGKSCLMSRFVDNIYNAMEFSCCGVDFKIRTINLDGTIIKLQIWDGKGQERMRYFTRSYYSRVHGIIIVYDVTDRESFDNIKEWLKDINNYRNENVNKLIIGNKCDLTTKRVVDYAEAKEYADSLNIPFFETSAKDSINVEEAFSTLVTNIKSSISSWVLLDLPDELTSNMKTKELSQRITNMSTSVVSTSTSNQQYVDSKISSHLQNEICSKDISTDCVQRSDAVTTDQVNNIQHILNDKMNILDRISAAAKERVNTEYNRIMAQATTDRNQAYAQIDQLIDEYKKQIQDKTNQLNHLSLNEIPSFTEHITDEIKYINEDNNQMFSILCTLPNIQVKPKQ